MIQIIHHIHISFDTDVEKRGFHESRFALLELGQDKHDSEAASVHVDMWMHLRTVKLFLSEKA